MVTSVFPLSAFSLAFPLNADDINCIILFGEPSGSGSVGSPSSCIYWIVFMVSLSGDVPGKNALNAKIGEGMGLRFGNFFIVSISNKISSTKLLHFL